MENLLVKLKAFGSSPTFGEELLHPELSAWPVLLGKKLNLPVENYGQCGAGNEEIIHTAIANSPETEKSLIIILSTHPKIVYWPNLKYNSYQSFKDPEGEGDRYSPAHKAWIKYHFIDDDYERIVINYHNSLFKSCKELLAFRGHIVYNYNYKNHLNINITNALSFVDVCQGYPQGQNGIGHYLEEAQEAWADYVYNIIK